MENVGLGFIGGETTTSTGIGARGGSFLCDCRKAGRRIGDLVGRAGTCLWELKRAVICSSDGIGFAGFEGLDREILTVDLLIVLDCMSLGSRKSTCSTQGSTEYKSIPPIEFSNTASNKARGELRPGEGRE
jgi:hypothetical protein